MVRVVLVGGIAERKGRNTIEVELGEPTVGELMKLLAKHVPEAIDEDGKPKPGFLVFIDGVDVRVLEEGDRVRRNSTIHIVQVYHGG